MFSGTPYPYRPTILLAPAAAYSGTYWQNRSTNCAGCRKKCGTRAQSGWRHIISCAPEILQPGHTHKDETRGRALETNECTISPSLTASVRSTSLELHPPRMIPSIMNFLAVQ